MCLYQGMYLLFTGFIIIVLQNMMIWPCQDQRTASRLTLSNATPPKAGFQAYVSSVFPDGETQCNSSQSLSLCKRWPGSSQNVESWEEPQDQQRGARKDDNMGAWFAKEEQVLCSVWKSCMRS